MKPYILLTILLVIACIYPAPTHAADVYANALIDSTANILTPENAIGEPDGAYADFRDSDTELTLDMGEGEEGTGDLTLYFKMFDYGARVNVTFRDSDNNALYDTGIGLPSMVDSESIIYPYDTPYRYVDLSSPRTNQWSLDAVAAESYVGASAESDATATDDSADDASEVLPPTEDDIAGMLIKLENSNTVYVLGSDDKRHAFPNQVIFDSWYNSSESAVDITTVDATTMASYKLGANVTMRPGTWLVKITTDPKVYAVEPGGVLRWVQSEEIAEALYGESWNTKIADVADVFWPNYTFGEDITSAVYPDGIVVSLDGGSGLYEIANAGEWYIENGNRYAVAYETWVELGIPSTFRWAIDEESIELYVDGGDFELTNDVRYPF